MKILYSLMITLLPTTFFAQSCTTSVLSPVMQQSVGGGNFKIFPAAPAVSVTRYRPQDNSAQVSSVENVTSESGFAVDLYPNPASDKVYLHFQNSSAPVVNVIIYDITGRKIFESEFSSSGNFQNELNVAGYQTGVYLITAVPITGKGTKEPTISKLIQIVNP